MTNIRGLYTNPRLTSIFRGFLSDHRTLWTDLTVSETLVDSIVPRPTARDTPGLVQLLEQHHVRVCHNDATSSYDQVTPAVPYRAMDTTIPALAERDSPTSQHRWQVALGRWLPKTAPQSVGHVLRRITIMEADRTYLTQHQSSHNTDAIREGPSGQYGSRPPTSALETCQTRRTKAPTHCEE